MKRATLVCFAVTTAIISLVSLMRGPNTGSGVVFAGAGVIGDHVRLRPKSLPTERPDPTHQRTRPVANRSARRVVSQPKVTSAPAPSRAPTTSTSGAAGQLVAWISQARSSQGLRSTAWNGSLVSWARSHSSSMASRGQLYHTDPSTLLSHAERSCSCSTAGEIVGKGSSVRQVFDLFMADAAHRNVIMNSAFRYAGAGIVYSRGWYWVTVQFAG